MSILSVRMVGGSCRLKKRGQRDFSFFPAEISYKVLDLEADAHDSYFQVPSISSSPPLPPATSDYFTLSPVEGPMS